MKERAIEIGIPKEEVVVESYNAREVEEGMAATEGQVAMNVVLGGGGEIEMGEDRFQGRVIVDERVMSLPEDL
ncbi:hypothetical protein C2S53_020445 [Perilla frutescens var. hirtella]|uniref:Uncharacterized protein n=1 Tax=Perilla frutescens var. hirtella TaxID=608512 RepID=A0AAD4JG88_PERFH|nr:hypothetical protein C2S53_020445 [Perilla frutescens var. hirtella]